MKKVICIAICLAMFICLFSGCRKSGAPDNTTDTASATEDAATEPTPSEDSDTKALSENTEPSNTVTTTPPPTESTTQAPTQMPSTDKPTDTKPTEPTDQTPSSNIIAGGKWDFGPVTWEITSDGVLTFAGNHHIQEKSSYIWQDYANIVTKVVFKEGITTIPRDGFKGMSNITSVQFGSTVTKINEYAFCGCTALTSVIIPQSTKVISQYAFYGCTSLRSVSFAPGCKLEEIEEKAFASSGLQEFTAPAGLRTINSEAFADCTNLTSVRLEGGISTVLAKAFKGCTGLKHVVLGSSITFAGGYIFQNCNALTTLEYNTSAQIEFSGYTNLTKVVIGGTRTSTGSFEGCTSLSSVTINANVTKIPNSAFRNCHSLTTITLPDSLRVIEANAFRNSGITSIIIPAQVTEIGFFCFGSAPLNQVTFTGNAPSFDIHNSFYNVTATVYYPEENTTWSEEVRQNYGGTLTWVAR